MNQEDIRGAEGGSEGLAQEYGFVPNDASGTQPKGRKGKPQIAVFLTVQDAYQLGQLCLRRMKKEHRDVGRDEVLAEAIRLLSDSETPGRRRSKGA